MVQPVGLFSEYAGFCPKIDEALTIGEYGYSAWHNPWGLRPFQCPDIFRKFRTKYPEVLVTLNVPFIRMGHYGATTSIPNLKFHADWCDLVLAKGWFLKDRVSGARVVDPAESGAEEATYDFRIPALTTAYAEYLVALLTPFLAGDMGDGAYLDEIHDSPPWWEAPSGAFQGVANAAVSALLWRQGIARVLSILRDRLPLGTVLRANGNNSQRLDGQTLEHWAPNDPLCGFGAPYGLEAVSARYPYGLNAIHFHWDDPKAATKPGPLDPAFRAAFANTLALALLYGFNVVVCPDGRWADIRKTIWDLRGVVPEWFSKPLGAPTGPPRSGSGDRIVRDFANGQASYSKPMRKGLVTWNDGAHL